MADPLIGMTISFEAAAPPKHDAPRGGLGSQVLPVAELDDDWEGSPEDGSQYLALVRREAATHAAIQRVDNPYETMESESSAISTALYLSRPSEAWREVFVRNFEQARKRMLLASIHSLPPVDPAKFPSARDEGAWRVFINGKRAKVKPPPVKAAASKPDTAPLISTAPPASAPPSKEDIEMTDLEAAKAAILASLEMDAPEPGESAPIPPSPSKPAAPSPTPDPAPSAQVPEFERLPQLPSPSLLVAIPGPSLIHILSHFNEWFTERFDNYEEALNFVPSTIFAPPALRRKPGSTSSASSSCAATPSLPAKKPPAKPPLPTAHESHWLLSLLTRLERLLDGEDLANLRQLAKTLAQLAEESAKKEAPIPAGGRSMEQRLQAEEEAEGRARCWMVVVAISSVWAQGDLWDPSL
ncbi:hypothetical protein JCM8547_008349 [Rhodosporidiobolus lusitaniae]